MPCFKPLHMSPNQRSESWEKRLFSDTERQSSAERSQTEPLSLLQFPHLHTHTHMRGEEGGFDQLLCRLSMSVALELNMLREKETTSFFSFPIASYLCHLAWCQL